MTYTMVNVWISIFSTFQTLAFVLAKRFLQYNFFFVNFWYTWLWHDTKKWMPSNVSNHNDIWSTLRSCESSSINNITRCRRHDRGYGIIILWSIIYYYRCASYGIRSTWAYKRPSTLDPPSKDVALAAVIERLPPGKSLVCCSCCSAAPPEQGSRTPPTDSDRPPEGGCHSLVCCCPLVSKYIPKYNITIIIIINIHYHCNMLHYYYIRVYSTDGASSFFSSIL